MKELFDGEYAIPKGYTASIENGKIIVKKEDSEDEKIRKEILEYFQQFENEELRGVNISDWIAWLEKQGDIDRRIQEEIEKQIKQQWKAEKQCEPKFRVGDVMRTWQEAFNGIKDGLPVVVAIDDENYRCNNEIISITDQEDYEYPPMNRKQTPAWSEEDESMLQNILECLKNGWRKLPTDVLKYESWFKSLKERVQSQTKQEWKPSDEQIEALRSVVTELKHSDNKYQETIEDLYNDLNKLREE